jgi:hypothetical protein
MVYWAQPYVRLLPIDLLLFRECRVLFRAWCYLLKLKTLQLAHGQSLPSRLSLNSNYCLGAYYISTDGDSAGSHETTMNAIPNPAVSDGG